MVELEKVRALWNRVRDSLWFMPAVLTVLAAALATATIQLDSRVRLDDDLFLVFNGTAEGARGVLGAIASGLITVTGVVFSITIVALQLASTQFTPRVLRNFTADRANQVVLGVFIGTFTYALLVLRMVRSDSGTSGVFIPNISVTVAVGLALVSIGFLIFYIDHAARSVQASVIIDRVTQETLATVERDRRKESGADAEDRGEKLAAGAAGSRVLALASGYVQGIDRGRLLSALEDRPVTVRLEPHMGDFVMDGSALATVWPLGLANDDPLADQIRDAFVLGHERTPHQDVELGIIELVDIAVKALSPGINDPTTATLCLDRLIEILSTLGRREPPVHVHRPEKGTGLLLVPHFTFDHLVEIALDQIRHFGASNPRFLATLLRRIEALSAVLPPAHHPPLARQAAAALREGRTTIDEPSDLARVERAAQDTLAALGVGA